MSPKLDLVKDETYDFLYRDKQTSIFYVRKSEVGRKPLFKSLRESASKGRAKEKALDAIAAWKGQVRVRDEAITFAEVAALVTNNKKNHRQNTKDKYENQFKVLLPIFGETRIEQVDEQAWEQFIFDRRQIKADYSFATTLAVLRDVVNRAFERKYVERKPKFRNPDKDRDSKGRVFSRAEIVRVLRCAAPKSGRHSSWRFNARHAIALSFYEALRRGDVTKLSWDRIDLEAGTLFFNKQVTKNKKARTIPLHPKSLQILRRRKAQLGNSSPWVFPARHNSAINTKDFNTAFQGSLERAKVGKDSRGISGRFHDIRRSALTLMFKQAKNHLMVCYLRDVSIQVATTHYIQWSISDLKGWAK